jgi:Kef-type K+ transport system membrane component KefB
MLMSGLSLVGSDMNIKSKRLGSGIIVIIIIVIVVVVVVVVVSSSNSSSSSSFILIISFIIIILIFIIIVVVVFVVVVVVIIEVNLSHTYLSDKSKVGLIYFQIQAYWIWDVARPN